MSKLQSLYFKLNPENPKHKYIIDFFETNNHMNKIDLLLYVIHAFRYGTIFKDEMQHKDN